MTVTPMLVTLAALAVFTCWLGLTSLLTTVIPAEQFASTLVRHPSKASAAGSTLLQLAALQWLIGALSADSALRTAPLALRADVDDRSDHHSELARRTAAGTGFLGTLRIAVGSLILMLWLPTLTLALVASLALASWLVGAGWTTPVDMAIQLAATWQGTTPRHPLPVLLVVGVWVITLLPVIALTLLAWGHLAREQINLRRWAAQTRSRPTPQRTLIEAALSELTARSGRRAPAIIAAPADEPRLAGSLGVVSLLPKLRPALLVDLSITGGMDIAALRALLAHELAHVDHRDHLRHTFVRLAGRLLLVGDSIVGVFERSLQLEHRADVAAIEDYGVEPADLARGLRLLSDISAITGVRRHGMCAIDPRVRHAVLLRDNQPQRRWLWEKVAAWWWLYTGDTTFGYWHPHLNERVSSLTARQLKEV